MASMDQRPLISIVTPFFNEGAGVLHFHQSLKNSIDDLTNFDFEIICIDDGSKDETLSRLMSVTSV